MEGFYSDRPDSDLRFGDIIEGSVIASIMAKELPMSGNFNIEVTVPGYAVVLSPCCAIGDRTILLSPLQPIPLSYLKNPFMSEDLTRINRIMTPEQAAPPDIWSHYTHDERLAKEQEGQTYAFMDIFIYQGHDLLKEYELGNGKRTSFYRIDFRRMTRVGCDMITQKNRSANGSKILELSVSCRQELREKMAKYFGRTPDEDKALMD